MKVQLFKEYMILVGSKMSEEFGVNIGLRQGSALS